MPRALAIYVATKLAVGAHRGGKAIVRGRFGRNAGGVGPLARRRGFYGGGGVVRTHTATSGLLAAFGPTPQETEFSVRNVTGRRRAPQ
jgi:hypothetical protein